MGKHHLRPGKMPKTYTQAERLGLALACLRAAQTHLHYAQPPWHPAEAGLRARLASLSRGLVGEERALCAALELAIDAEAKKGRAA